ncbi:MAG: LysR family transcriptional regulator [Pseudomonadota bacterium]
MDIVQAKTFLAIIEGGNFVEASKRVFVTQSTVSARIKALEDQLGKSLFNRSKSGCELTPAGHQFYRFARSLVRVWEEAKHQVAVPEGYEDTLIIGGQYSLWNRFLLQWVPAFEASHPTIALRCEIGMPRRLMREMNEGVMDLAIIYRPENRPGLIVEELLEDRLVLVTTDISIPLEDHYIFTDWGDAFRAMHAETYPEIHNPGLTLDLGALGVNMLIQKGGAAYFPERVVQTHIEEGLLFIVEEALDFQYPAYVVYQEEFSTPEIMDKALSSLRRTAGKAIDGDLPPPFWAEGETAETQQSDILGADDKGHQN